MYIFISYSSKNTDEATNACKKLEEAGHNCFLAYRDIAGGSVYAEELVNAIDRSDAMLLLLSEGANSSPHVLREVERGCSKNIPIIVYKLEDVVLSKSLEYFLMTHQWVTKDDDDERLIGVFKNLEKRRRELESCRPVNSKTENSAAENGKSVDETAAVSRTKESDAEQAKTGKLRQTDDETDSNAPYEKGRFVITRRTLYILAIIGVLLIATVIVLVIAVSKRGSDTSTGDSDRGIIVDKTVNSEKTPGGDADSSEPIEAGANDSGDDDSDGSGAGANETEVKGSDGSGAGATDTGVKDSVDKDSDGTGAGANETGVKDSDGSGSGSNETGAKDSKGTGSEVNNAGVKDSDKSGSEANNTGDKESDGTGSGAADAGVKDSEGSTPVSDISKMVQKMKPGECITIGSYRDEPIEWVALHKNDDGSTILISKDILCLKMFDAPESGEFGTCTDEALLNGEPALDCTYWTSGKVEKYGAEALIEAYGNNDWSVSNIRCWLNADRNMVNYEDSAPGKVFPGDSWPCYSDEKGFLKNFTDEEKSALSEYSYTYVNSITGEKTELHDKVFLLSEKELEWFYNEDISPLAKIFESALVDDYEKIYENYNNNGYFFWWLRDGSKKAACISRYVSNSLDEPVYEYISSYYGFGGIRPCICIK